MTDSLPDDTIAWCGTCQIEIKGNSNWIAHLDSDEHKANVVHLSVSRFVEADHIEKKSRTGTKIALSSFVVIVIAFVFSPNLIEFIEDQIGIEIIVPNTESLDDEPLEITIDETRIVERQTITGAKLEFNPDVIEILAHKFTNEQRVMNGLEPVKFDYEISNIARLHSVDMSKRNYFAHEIGRAHV